MHNTFHTQPQLTITPKQLPLTPQPVPWRGLASRSTEGLRPSKAPSKQPIILIIAHGGCGLIGRLTVTCTPHPRAQPAASARSQPRARPHRDACTGPRVRVEHCESVGAQHKLLCERRLTARPRRRVSSHAPVPPAQCMTCWNRGADGDGASGSKQGLQGGRRSALKAP